MGLKFLLVHEFFKVVNEQSGEVFLLGPRSGR